MNDFRNSLRVLQQVASARNIGVLPIRGVTNEDLAASIRKAGFASITFRGRFLDDTAGNVSAILVVGNPGDDHGGLKGFMRQMRREPGVGVALLRTTGGDAVMLKDTGEEPWQGPTSDLPSTIAGFCSSIWERPCLFDDWDQPPTWFGRYAAWVQGRS